MIRVFLQGVGISDLASVGYDALETVAAWGPGRKEGNFLRLIHGGCSVTPGSFRLLTAPLCSQRLVKLHPGV